MLSGSLFLCFASVPSLSLDHNLAQVEGSGLFLSSSQILDGFPLQQVNWSWILMGEPGAIRARQVWEECFIILKDLFGCHIRPRPVFVLSIKRSFWHWWLVFVKPRISMFLIFPLKVNLFVWSMEKSKPPWYLFDIIEEVIDISKKLKKKEKKEKKGKMNAAITSRNTYQIYSLLLEWFPSE